MKKAAIIIPALTLVAIGAGVAPLATRAASSTTTNTNNQVNQRPQKKELTAEEQAKMQAEHQVRQAEMEAKRQKESAAIEAGDYNAWLEAVGSDCLMAKKITKENFAQYQEVYKLRTQLETKMKALGLDEVKGGPDGEHRGGHRGGLGKANIDNTNTQTTK